MTSNRKTLIAAGSGLLLALVLAIFTPGTRPSVPSEQTANPYGFITAGGGFVPPTQLGDKVAAGAGIAVTGSGQTKTVAVTGAVGPITGTVIRPTALTGTVDDWAPTGFATATDIVVGTSGATTLDGVAGGAEGREFTLCNTGTFSLTLANQAAGSTAANRFSLAGAEDWVLGATGNSCASFLYDGTALRWKMKSKTGTSMPSLAVIGAATVGTTLGVTGITTTAGVTNTRSGSPDGVLTAALWSTITDSATGVVWQNVDGATGWEPIVIPPKYGYDMFDDFYSSGSWTHVGATGGAGGRVGVSPHSVYQARATAVTSSSMFTYLNFTDLYSLSTTAAGWLDFGVYLMRLSDGSDNAIIRIGHGDAALGVDDFTDGVYIEYDFATNGDHRWRLCTANGGVRTKVDTGITAVANSSGLNFTRVSIKFTAAHVVTCKINGVACSTSISTNFPAGATGLQFQLSKQLGSAQIMDMRIDYARVRHVLTSSATRSL